MANIGRIVHFDIDLTLPLKQVHAAPMIKGDRLADVIEITLNNRGETVDPSGLTAVANAELSGQDGVTVRNPGTVGGGKITIPLQADCYAVPGSIRITVTLKSGSTTRTVLVLTGYVEQNGTGIVIDPTGSVPSYDDIARIVAELEAAKQAANTATTAANNAASNAGSNAAAANTAAQTANTAANTANAAAAKIDGMTVSASGLAAGASPTAAVSETGGHKHIAFGIPRGDTGATPRITIGTVVTGEPGADAAASIRGTAEEPVLDLTIPQGPEGTVNGIPGKIMSKAESYSYSWRIVHFNSDSFFWRGLRARDELTGKDELQISVNSSAVIGARKYNEDGTFNDYYTVNSVNGKAPRSDGRVTLTPEDVGARPDTWMPTAADVGALAAGGTAANASQLGGKAPAYYARPRNLLDNSDFTNPVNQAGVGGKHGAQAYAVDRWILDSGAVSVEAGVGLALNGTIRQKLEFSPTGAVSAFVGMASGTASISYADGEVTIVSAGGVLKWAALYVGAYTADTLPPYVPKGYAAELAECMRYFALGTQQLGVPYTGLNVSAQPVYICDVTYPVPMRVQPTVTIQNIKSWVSQDPCAISANVNIADKYGINSLALSEARAELLQFDYEASAEL